MPSPSSPPDVDGVIRILCVDDQPGNLTALEAVFLESGYTLVLAHSGREAARLALREEFALILMDVQMPTLDGFETARLIRGEEKSRITPIIFLTANHPNESQALLGYEAGAVDYLFKPLNITMLRAKVAVFVELFRKNKELLRQSELLRTIEQSVSEKKYQTLVEGIRDGIVWTMNPRELKFDFVSGRAESITGHAEARWLTEKDFWIRNTHPEDRASVLEAFKNARVGDAARALEHRFITAQGETLWFHTELHLAASENAASSELRGLSLNITHLKDTERALREAVRIRDDFLSIASHELRTPITPVQLQMQGFLRMMETGTFDTTPRDKLKSMLEISQSQIGRLGRLVDQLLDVTRISEGRLLLRPTPLELDQLLQQVTLEFQHELETSGCSLELLITEKISGLWDRLRIEQVVINLMTNAVKYGEGKPVSLKLRRMADWAVIEVKDRGLGIAPADRQRIFEKFERAVPATNFGGLGLGLYITRQIVELHGGRIELESHPGQGSVFTVYLPISAQAM